MKELTTTLYAMCDCLENWKGLLQFQGKTAPDDDPLPLESILDSNGFADALQALMTVKGYDDSLRLYACHCAKLVLPIFEEQYPDDKRPRQAIETAERFAKGQATGTELDCAGLTADAAVMVAMRSVGLSVMQSAKKASNAVTKALEEALRANGDFAASLAVADTAEDAADAVKKAWASSDAAWTAARAAYWAAVRGESTAKYLSWAVVEAMKVSSEMASLKIQREFIRLCRLEGEYGVVAAREWEVPQ